MAAMPGMPEEWDYLILTASNTAQAEAREELEREPLNERARFFDCEINHVGLEVTTC
ncbi:MAG: hypothetical protein ABSE56_20255 [Bryobacteraceae bacterium]|jgi:hypothetical protein